MDFRIDRTALRWKCAALLAGAAVWGALCAVVYRLL
jgi:hypothetical protein